MGSRVPDVAEVRPRLPWLSRIGTKNGELTSLGMLIRGTGALLAVVNPVTALVLWVELVALSRTRINPRWLTLGGGFGVIVALVTGWVAEYNAVWRDLAYGVQAAIEVRSVDLLREVVTGWPGWVLGQLPVAVCLGTMLCGMVLSYRRKYRAVWRERPSPPSARAVKRARAQVEAAPRRVQAATRADDIVIRFGVDLDTATPYTIPASAFRMHAVVAGPTGFGKSTSIQRIIDGLVAELAAQPANVGVVLIDMKADPEMVRFLGTVAAAAGRRFHLVTVDPVTADRYNPLRHGDAAQIKNKLIETEANSADGGFSEPHYRRLGERFLLLCAKVLCELVEAQVSGTFGGRRRTYRKDLPDLVSLMQIPKLAEQTDRLSPSLAHDLRAYLTEIERNKKLAEDLYGIYNRFALIVDGPAGPILTDTDDGLDMLAAMRRGDIVALSLDAMSETGTARQLGNLAVQDVTHCMGQLAAEGFGKNGGMSFVCVDEFSALGGSLLVNLYARGRSAGAGVCLASQDLDGDLGAVSPEFKTQVLTNANVVILHQQRGESPNTWANAIGTREVWKETLQVTADAGLLGTQEAASGVGSLRQAHEFLIAPDTLRTLGQGQAIVKIGHPTTTVTRVSVSHPPERNAPASTPAPNSWKTAVPTSTDTLPNPWKKAAEAITVVDPLGDEITGPDLPAQRGGAY